MSAELAESSIAADSLETWTAVLDLLEAAVDDAIAADLAAEDLDETNLAQQPAVFGSWTPPADIGPLPEILVDRARHINERQQSAAAQLVGELRTLRQHRSVLGSVQTATAPQQASVYLDVTG